jgi:hypothetical protein
VEKITKNSKEWYDEAGKQTFNTLPEFIKRVQDSFPGYPSIDDAPISHDEMKQRYKNGIIAGILVSLAAFHATSHDYGYSCNQAGVVRNIFYKAVFDEQMDFERI